MLLQNEWPADHADPVAWMPYTKTAEEMVAAGTVVALAVEGSLSLTTMKDDQSSL